MQIIQGVPICGDPVDQNALKQILNCARFAERVAMAAV